MRKIVIVNERSYTSHPLPMLRDEQGSLILDENRRPQYAPEVVEVSQEVLDKIHSGELLFDGTKGKTKPNPNYVSLEIRKQLAEQKQTLQAELKQLLNWFTWYDQQVIQAGRAERLNLEWDATDDDGTHYATLQQLDEAATLKAEAINSLRQELEEM